MCTGTPSTVRRTHPDVADTPPPQRARKTPGCAEEPASCAWVASRCARVPPDVLQPLPKMCEDATRCAWEASDVPEILPDVPGIPPDLPEHPQMCL